jgi:hypothetical protein
VDGRDVPIPELQKAFAAQSGGWPLRDALVYASSGAPSKKSIFTGKSALSSAFCYSQVSGPGEKQRTNKMPFSFDKPHHGAARGVVADNWAIPNQMHRTQVRWINKAKVVAVRRGPPRSEDDRGFAPHDSDAHALPIAVRFIATRPCHLAIWPCETTLRS